MSAEVRDHALVQLWTTSPGRDGLEALNGAWDLWPGRRCRGVVSSHGKKRKLQAGSPSDLAARACESPLNHLEITLQGTGGKTGNGAKTLAAGVLRVSPLNECWARLRADAVPGGANWRRRVDDLSTQSAVAWNELREWPSTLSLLLARELFGSIEELGQTLAGALEATGSAELAGTVDAVSNEPAFWQVGPLARLGRWVRALPQLRERFDGPHEILICKTRVAGEIASALPSAARVLTSGDRLAALSLTAGEGEIDDLESDLRPWLVEKSAATAPRPADETRGELEIGSRVFLTRRRRQELEEAGFERDRVPDTVRAPVVEEELCHELGVDPLEMIEFDGPAQNLSRLREEIRNELDRPGGASRAERILAAHERAFLAWMNGLHGGYFGVSTRDLMRAIRRIAQTRSSANA